MVNVEGTFAFGIHTNQTVRSSKFKSFSSKLNITDTKHDLSLTNGYSTLYSVTIIHGYGAV